MNAFDPAGERRAHRGKLCDAFLDRCNLSLNLCCYDLDLANAVTSCSFVAGSVDRAPARNNLMRLVCDLQPGAGEIHFSARLPLFVGDDRQPVLFVCADQTGIDSSRPGLDFSDG